MISQKNMNSLKNVNSLTNLTSDQNHQNYKNVISDQNYQKCDFVYRKLNFVGSLSKNITKYQYYLEIKIRHLELCFDSKVRSNQ